MNLYKPTELLKLLKDLDLKPKKSLSQNFLIDKNIVAKIIAFSDISNKSVVLEIGPGFGTLTSFILEKCKKLIAIEQDKILTKILKKNLKNQKLEIKNANFLDLDLNFLKNFNQKVKVISSIPYHLTQPIIMKLLKNHFLFSSIILLIQKEVAQKIISSPNSKKYNSFSLLINFYADVQIISYVSKNSFLPKPKVDSAIIKLNLKKPKKKKSLFQKEEKNFFPH